MPAYNMLVYATMTVIALEHGVSSGHYVSNILVSSLVRLLVTTSSGLDCMSDLMTWE